MLHDHYCWQHHDAELLHSLFGVRPLHYLTQGAVRENEMRGDEGGVVGAVHGHVGTVDYVWVLPVGTLNTHQVVLRNRGDMDPNIQTHNWTWVGD